MTYLYEQQFNQYLQAIERAPYVTVDTEGTLTHPFSETWGLSISVDGLAEYFAFNHNIGNNLSSGWLPKLARAIENHKCLVFHNAKHDLKALRNLGISYTGKFYDTMLMAHMIDENIPSKKLDYLSKKYGGEPKRNEDVQKAIIKGFGWPYIPVEVIRPYGANDAYITEQLFNRLKPEFQTQEFDADLWDWEQKFLRLLVKIEDQGLLINQPLSEQELDKGLKIMAMIQKRLGFNPGSPAQLGDFLINELHLPVVKYNKPNKKGSRNPSFDKDAMEIYDEMLSTSNNETAKLILTYRGWQKTTSSNYRAYLERLNQDGRIRCNYKQHGTRTGRLSCEEPNLQQIPRSSKNEWNGNLKAAFITDTGRTAWEFDYSQLEFRLGAAYSKDRNLIDVFNDPNRDIFTEMAASLGMVRDDVKRLNYSIQYGAGVTRVKNLFGVSEGEARKIINNYYKQNPGLRRITNYAAAKCREQGYVNYWTGRRRHFTDPENQAHKAFNSVIQGGGFELVKRAMVRLDDAGLNNDECRIDLQVHDSVRVDVEDGKEHIYLPEIKRVLETTPDFGVEFRVDCHRWNTKETWDGFKRDGDATEAA